MEKGVDNPCSKIFGIITGVLTIGLLATITVYLGLYGYKNPDPQACWVVRDLHTSSTTRNDVVSRANAMGIDILEGYPIEMHKVYVVWFLWGFWAHVATIVLALIVIPVILKKENLRFALGSCSCCLYSVNMFVWLAFGGIWRFSKAGVIASGDKLERLYGMTDAQWTKSLEAAQASNGYQVNSGRFMKIYLMLVAWVIILFILGSVVTTLVMCCCMPPESSELFKPSSLKSNEKSQSSHSGIQSDDEGKHPRFAANRPNNYRDKSTFGYHGGNDSQ